MHAVFIKALSRTLSLFPLSILHKLGTITGFILLILPNKTKHIASANIKHCFPTKTTREQKTLLQDTLIETAKTFMEASAFWYWPEKKLRGLLHETSSTLPLKRSILEGKGAIVITPHIGAWEIVGLYCAQLNPITAMYRPPRQAALGPIIKQARERLGLKLAATDQNGIRALSRALKQHEIIGILPDQDPGQNGGVFANFFGKPANTMTLVSRLAIKTQCPAFFVYAERLDQGRGYSIHCIEAPAELSNGTIEQSTSSLNKTIESCANHIPSQYQWGYKRFKNQPEGMPDIYRNKN